MGLLTKMSDPDTDIMGVVQRRSNRWPWPKKPAPSEIEGLHQKVVKQIHKTPQENG